MLEVPMLVPLLSSHSRHTRDGGALGAGLLRLARRAAALIELYTHERRIAHDVRYLSSFDDRMLSDIGLARCEIEGAVRRRATRGWR
jgi:uncharacterized protein YjiS (DUF1127 family)